MSKLLFILLFTVTSVQAGYVRSYSRSDGTYVSGYYRGSAGVGTSGTSSAEPVVPKPYSCEYLVRDLNNLQANINSFPSQGPSGVLNGMKTQLQSLTSQYRTHC